jgi:hypothetical protein
MRIPGKLLWEEVAAFVAQEVPAFVMAGLGLIHLHLQSGASTTMLELAPFTLHYAYRQVGADSDWRFSPTAEVGTLTRLDPEAGVLKKLS